jgi:hypothetical protein
VSRGHQWIHFDAQFPLKFGHDLCERFGPAGELLFILFLCGCKRSYPQGQINYRGEEELRVVLGAHFDFVDNAGDKWSLDDYWRWCGKRKVTRTKTLNTRKYVTATRWDTWEDDYNSKERERKRRSRARLSADSPAKRLEVGSRGVRGGWRLEVGGGSAEGGTGEPAAGHAAEKPLTHLVEEIKTQADHAADRNGTQP